MKKTLVALAVAAVAASATTAQAATLYEKDGAKVNLSGSVRMAAGKFGKDERADLRNDGSRVRIDVSQDLGNGLNGFAAYELRFQNGTQDERNTFGDPNTKRLYAGLSHADVGTLSFGRQLTNGDEVQLGDYAYTFGGNNNLTTDGDKVIKFTSKDFNGLRVGGDYVFGHADKNSTGMKSGYGFALFYTTDLADDVRLNLNAGYTKDKEDEQINSSATTGTKKSWRTAAEVEVKDFAFAVNYGETKYSDFYGFKGIGGYKLDNTPFRLPSAKERAILVGAKYQIIEPSKVYLQWRNARMKAEDLKATIDTIIAGVDYKLHKNIVTYIEYEHARAKIRIPGDSEHGKLNRYVAGFRAFF